MSHFDSCLPRANEATALACGARTRVAERLAVRYQRRVLDTVISVENLSKSYLVGHQAAPRGQSTLRDVLTSQARDFARKAADLIRGRPIVEGDDVEEFWALRDISFEIQRGEAVGIIGKNGAGKSTLLKILSRITDPSGGKICLRGRVSSLLEVGTGFHSELSGRENIFLNGAILGMERQAIKRRFDEIVDFAGVEQFIDTPVKRYSSGMYVRLAFAVAAHLEPEILLVDEVLAVGDVEFQGKCLGKMKDVARGGRTVLFVSHNMRAIQGLCPRSILLHRGQLAMIGTTEQCIERYLGDFRSAKDSTVDLTSPNVSRHGSGECAFISASLRDVNGNETASFSFGQPFVVELCLRADKEISDAILGFSFVDGTGHEIMGTSMHDSGQRCHLAKGDNRFRCTVDPMILTPGSFTLRAAVFKPGVVFDHIDELMSFEIVDAAVDLEKTPKNHFVGDVFLKYDWAALSKPS
jgi:lipopolysaccharide transport system ATP-binding protein